MKRLLAILFILGLGTALGCGGGGDGGASPTPSPSPTATPGGDAGIFARIVAGELDAVDGMSQIAASGGWPIATATGYVFARLDDGGGPWSLAGDHNGWSPTSMVLGGGVWWTEVPVPSPIGSKYKFVSGASDYSADPLCRRYAFDSFGEISLVGAAGNHLERYFAMTDGVVAPRTVRVWVPAAASTHHLYVHDGQNLFDPGAAFGGWKLQDVLSTTTLAVGIDNTSSRMSEYTHVTDVIGGSTTGGTGDAYADFVENTVRPFVEAKWGTPARAGTMGSSLGGLIAFHLVQRHAGRYDFAASLSGTMGWGSINASNETMIERYVASGHDATTLYLDSGGSGGSGCADTDADGIKDDTADASDNFCENAQMRDDLLAVGYVINGDLFHWHEAGAGHNEAAWANRVFRPVDLFEAL